MDYESYINDLKDYINNSKAELTSYATAVGWKHKVGPLLKQDKILDEKLNDYKLLIDMIKEKAGNSGKSKNLCNVVEELPDPIPKCFLGHEKMAITISDDVKLKLLKATRTKETLPAPPVTANDYFINYTAEERNILYKFAISNCIRTQTPPGLMMEDADETSMPKNTLSNENEELLRLEKLKKERDLKRRRQAYRRKVSTKNKSQTEVTREVIANIMEALGYTNEQIIEKQEKKDILGSSNSESISVNQLGVWADPHEGFDKFRFSGNFDACKSRNYVNNYQHRTYHKEYDRRKDWESYSNLSNSMRNSTEATLPKYEERIKNRESGISRRVSEKERSKHSNTEKGYSRSDKSYSKNSFERSKHSYSNKKYQEDAKISSPKKYQEDAKISSHKKYQEDAKISSQKKYQEDAKISSHKKYQEDAKISSQKKYKDVKLSSHKEYLEDGRVSSNKKYNDKISPTRRY